MFSTTMVSLDSAITFPLTVTLTISEYFWGEGGEWVMIDEVGMKGMFSDRSPTGNMTSCGTLVFIWCRSHAIGGKVYEDNGMLAGVTGGVDTIHIRGNRSLESELLYSLTRPSGLRPQAQAGRVIDSFHQYRWD